MEREEERKENLLYLNLLRDDLYLGRRLENNLIILQKKMMRKFSKRDLLRKRKKNDSKHRDRELTKGS